MREYYSYMNSQTTRRPENQRSAKSRKYQKQTARFDARRDGKPLIFGWGRHLSHNEKVRFQRRTIWTATIVFGLLIVAVVVGYWVNINVITPGLPITTVNGHQIPQSQYRKMVALQAQLELNKIYGPHGLFQQRTDVAKQVADQQQIVSSDTTKIDDLNKQISKLPPGDSAQRTDLNNQLTAAKKQLTTDQEKAQTLNQQLDNLTNNTIPQEQQNYNQPQIGNDSANMLQDDEFIREWLAIQSSALQSKIEPSASAVNRALNDFEANIPKSGPHASSYSNFLKQDNVSDADMRAMMTIKLRRDNMQNYLQSLVVSPTYQVHARSMTIDTLPKARNILNQLQHGADFGKLAKENSQDATTSSKGGDLGWLPRGQYTQTTQQAVVENWLFGVDGGQRKLNEISPILTENGAYHIVQILGFDPSRAVDPTELKSLQQNALTNWILSRHALPDTKIVPIDQDKLLDPLNMPPDLPLSAPGQQSGAPGGLPGGPGGQPGQP